MKRSKLATRSGEVSIALTGPSRPAQLLVLAHGAGAPMDSDFMAFFADALSGEERAVARFNFPYMEQARKSPGAAKASEEAFADVAAHIRRELSPAHLFLGGKSYGGRMASHIAASGTEVTGLVFLGYPLHPPGRPQNIRDAHLYGIEVPMLFVEGTRDPFCPLPTLDKVVTKLTDAEVVVIDDGDHSLKVRKSSGRDTETAWSEAAGAIAEWMERMSS